MDHLGDQFLLTEGHYVDTADPAQVLDLQHILDANSLAFLALVVSALKAFDCCVGDMDASNSLVDRTAQPVPKPTVRPQLE